MLSSLRLANVYAIIDSYGINHAVSITKINHPIIEHCVLSENLVEIVFHMRESIA
ncbi:hypothetical protein [Pantoea sp. Mhis]|uniref:hypothetical protein n=1 Tax=Pantoea sp. Mhis TaxID=2576759 RepID=UPI001359F952|nr:hypothetical protein [Pantoea sp. Mhis]